jgi:histone-lysine N-methyltransferase SETD2
MSDQENNIKPEAVDTALGEMKLEENTASEAKIDDLPPSPTDIERAPSQHTIKSRSTTPEKMQSTSQTPKSEYESHEEVVEAAIIVVQEPGKALKLSRKAAQKIIARPPSLFDDLEDATPEAITKFQVIRDCIYGSKYMGSADHDALGCDCSEDWRKFTLASLAIHCRR